MMTMAEIERYVDAAAMALALPLRAEDRAEVCRYLALAASMAERVEAVPLGPHHESAATFVPVAPASRPEPG